MYNNRKIIPVIPNFLDSQSENASNEDLSLFSKLYTFVNEKGEKSLDFIKDSSIQIPVFSNIYSRNVSSESLSLDFFLRTSRLNIFEPYFKTLNNNYSATNCQTLNRILVTLNHLTYDWEIHDAILKKQNFIPVIIDPNSPFHKQIYNSHFFSFRFSENLQELFPDFKLYTEEEIQFVFWKKNNYVFNLDENSENSQKVYSNCSEEIFTKLKKSSLNFSSETNTFQAPPFDFNCFFPTYQRNRSYYGLQARLETFLNNETLIGYGGDLLFLKDTIYQNSFETLLESKPESRLDVIKVPSWKSKSSDKKMELTSYTKSQVLKRQISFSGYFTTLKCLASENLEVDLNFFGLATFGDIRDTTTSTRALKRLVDFIQDLSWEGGVKFYDPDKALEIYNKMFDGLNLYSDVCCSKLNRNHLTQLLARKNSYFLPFQGIQNSSLTSEPKVNFQLKQKYEKIDLLYTENLNKISPNDFPHQIRKVKDITYDLNQYAQYLKRAKDAIKEAIDNLSSQIEEIYNAANFIKANNGIYSSIKNKYLEEFENSLLNMDFSQSDFFTNLAADKIYITEIHYIDSQRNEKILKNTSSPECFLAFIKNKNKFSPDFSITKLNFVIDRPVKIRIDSKNQFVLGGPYKVSCTKTSIDIALLKKESLFGVNDNALAIHPHTTTFSDIDRLFEYARGCLGEAASLIYKAFEKNDLKLIVLSAMTWVTSANSSDAWGRKYETFPDAHTLKTDSPETPLLPNQDEELTEAEVENFLTSACEDSENQEEEIFLNELQNQENQNFDDFIETEVSQNLNPQQQVWNPQNFATAPTQYSPAFANLTDNN